MRHRKFTFKIGKTSAHRQAMLANAACSLFKAGRITTTVVKAKQIRRLAERMITLGKKGTLHARRQAIAKLHQPDVVAEVFSTIAPQYEDRQGGYTRIMRLGQRRGDAAEMCVLELIQEPVGGYAAAESDEQDAAADAPAAVEAEKEAAAENSDT